MLELEASEEVFEKFIRIFVHPPGYVFDDIEFLHVAIFGHPHSGKTVTAESLGYYIEREWEQLHPDIPFIAVRALRLRDVFNYFDMEPPPKVCYLYIIIDDAERFAFSRINKENLGSIFDHDMIRHELRFRGMRRGQVTIVYCTQRYKNLNAVARNAHILMFKSINMNDPYEYETMYNIVGGFGLQILRDIVRQAIVEKNRAILGYSVVKYTWQKRIEVQYFFPAKPRNYIDLWSLATVAKAVTKEGKTAKKLEALEKLYFALKDDRIPVKETRKGDVYYVTSEVKKKLGIEYDLAKIARALNVRYATLNFYDGSRRALFFPVSLKDRILRMLEDLIFSKKITTVKAR